MILTWKRVNLIGIGCQTNTFEWGGLKGPPRYVAVLGLQHQVIHGKKALQTQIHLHLGLPM